MASPTQWKWVWVNSGNWWWTGRPGVLPSMGSQRVRHDWATELNWTDWNRHAYYLSLLLLGFPSGSADKRLCLQCGRPEFDPQVGKIPWRRERLPTPVFWPGGFHGLCSPWGHKELDTTISDFHTHMVIIDCAGSLLLHGLSSGCAKQGLLSSHSAWASHRGGVSCCGARAQGCTRSSNCGSWALELSSVVVQHRLNCSKACGIFLDQGSNLCLLHWQADSLPPSHQGSLTGIFWIIEKNIIKETYQDCLRQTISAIPLFTLRSIPIQVINYMLLLPMMHL